MKETINLPSTEEREVALEAFSENMVEEKNRSLGAVSVHDVEAEDTPLLVVREGNEVVPFICQERQEHSIDFADGCYAEGRRKNRMPGKG